MAGENYLQVLDDFNELASSIARDSPRDDGRPPRRLADRTIIPQELHSSKMSILLLLASTFRATSHLFLQRTNVDLPRIWRCGQAEQQISERFVMIGWLCGTRERQGIK